uniref:Mitochondrial sodium/calcium exchanger protein n=1 Tax=Petromyzon marinus TaxID=7757 RepID=A0AAJ7SQ06_PETMA|nr:mitochondrial sodium/calcium exchanger protein [Petromyzon marinus]
MSPPPPVVVVGTSRLAVVVMLLVMMVVGSEASSERRDSAPDPHSSSTSECRDYRSINVSERCHFVNSTPDCKIHDGYFDYVHIAFCNFPARMLPLPMTLYGLWLLVLFVATSTTAENFFCPALESISHSLHLSHNVAGVTLLAFGNGAPDVFSAVAAFSDPRTGGLAIGALLGAGIFVTTIVAGSVAWVDHFFIPSRPFLRDLVFYLVAVFWTFFVLYRGHINMGESIGYLGLYGGYVATVLIGSWIYKRQKATWFSQGTLPDYEGPVDLSDDDYDEPRRRVASIQQVVGDLSESLPLLGVPSGPTLACGGKLYRFLLSLSPLDPAEWRRRGYIWRLLKVVVLPVELLLILTVPVMNVMHEDRKWNRPLNCLQLMTGPLAALYSLNGGLYFMLPVGGTLPLWSLILAIGCLLAVVAFITTSEQPPAFQLAFAVLGFVVSALWMNAIANEVVNLLQTFGVVFGISSTVLGLTLLAWGNSVPDFVADITMARQGYPRMAISACFGGIVFNILVGIGLGCLLSMPPSHMQQLVPDVPLVWVLCASLGISLVLSFVALPLQGFYLTRKYGVCLFALYLAFLTVALLTEFKIIRF